MLPEVLSNGVCSLQEGVPRLCKSAFITFDEDAQPIKTEFANTVIRSANRLRYREAQAIIDADERDEKLPVPHPSGPRTIFDYDPKVVALLREMNLLSRRIQKRRLAAGQLVLGLPEVELVLDEEGKVCGTQPEDQSFTHTLIEMFMVEANEAVARLLDSMNVPFLRRVHPEPDMEDSQRLRHFVEVTGHVIPKILDRKALQKLLDEVKGSPEAFAINLAVLKSLTRAEYSPAVLGHYALASQHYCHFTSPIRRYADLTIHRLLDAYFKARGSGAARATKKKKLHLDDVPSHQELVELGRHISFTERRAEDAERELRQVKLLELMSRHIGEEFAGVITGITNFGVFVQIQEWLIDGLIRYEDLMDDWWDVDARGGSIRGQRTGKRIGIGDLCTVRVVKVDPPRRELDLAITQLRGRPGKLGDAGEGDEGVAPGKGKRNRGGHDGRPGGPGGGMGKGRPGNGRKPTGGGRGKPPGKGNMRPTGGGPRKNQPGKKRRR
jgi:ribonuclease R